MSEQKSPNLDRLAAETAQHIVTKHSKDARELDNLVTKALGVLQEQGVYAGLLYLYAQSEDAAKTIRTCLLEMLKDEILRPFNLAVDGDVSRMIWQEVSRQLLEERKLFDQIDKLFLIKELYEQTLIYARYGAKAAKVEAEGKSER